MHALQGPYKVLLLRLPRLLLLLLLPLLLLRLLGFRQSQ